MKTDDFERLKAVCEKEGFEICLDAIGCGTYNIWKKDPWEGVEFFKGADGIIRKIPDIETFRVLPLFDRCKPSTEEAYVEQLKKEAFERFGEIHIGDAFDRSKIRDYLGIEIVRNITKIGDTSEYSGYNYNKKNDRLFFRNLCLYSEGKWAKRVKERVKVTYSGASCKPHPIRNDMDLHEVRFYVNRTNGLPTSNAFDFLASQLEKYLNGEIE